MQDRLSQNETRGSNMKKVLIALIIASGAIALTHEVFYDRPGKDGEDAGSVPWDMAEAMRQLDQLQPMVQQALENDRVRTVLRDVERFTERFPEFSDGYTLLGQVFLGENDLESAYANLKISLDLDPAQAEIHLLAGSICHKLVRPTEAEWHYRQAKDLKPENMRYRLHFAQSLLSQQRLEEARDDLLALLRQDSSQHAAYAMLADLYMRQNKTTLAMNQINKAYEHTQLTDRDNQIVYLRQKSAILRRQNKPDDALQILERLSLEERRDPSVIEEMAICLSMQGQVREAALRYEKQLMDEPSDWRLAAGAARWWISAREWDKARVAVNKIRMIDPRLSVLAELEKHLNVGSSVKQVKHTPSGP